MNQFLKEILSVFPKTEEPITIQSIDRQLADAGCWLNSAMRNLEELGLVDKLPDGETFALSLKGQKYVSLSEMEQRELERREPFIIYRDLDHTENLSTERHSK